MAHAEVENVHLAQLAQRSPAHHVFARLDVPVQEADAVQLLQRLQALDATLMAQPMDSFCPRTLLAQLLQRRSDQRHRHAVIVAEPGRGPRSCRSVVRRAC